jgi:hypothetical protein
MLILLFLLEIQLVQCGLSGQSRMTDWHLIIPDDYQGFLVIMYECPEGKMFARQNNMIQVVFSNDGVFCASEKAFAWEGQVTASTASGNTVSSPILWDGRGYGLYGDGLLTVHSPTKYQFDVYWAGDIEYLASIRNTAEYTKQLNIFLEAQFGLNMSANDS